MIELCRLSVRHQHHLIISWIILFCSELKRRLKAEKKAKEKAEKIAIPASDENKPARSKEDEAEIDPNVNFRICCKKKQY